MQQQHDDSVGDEVGRGGNGGGDENKNGSRNDGNSETVSFRPHNNQLKGSRDNASEGDKEGECGKARMKATEASWMKSTRVVTAVMMTANGNEDTKRPHNTTIH